MIGGIIYRSFKGDKITIGGLRVVCDHIGFYEINFKGTRVSPQ